MRNLVIWTTVLVLAGMGAATVLAQEVSEDQKNIDRLATQWADAWNSQDIKAIAGLYTFDADYIAFTGEAFKGREAIEQTFAELSSGIFKGTKITIEMTGIHFIKPDLAVGDSSWALTDLPETEGETPTTGTSTVVVTKQDDQWLIAAHRSRIPAAPPGGGR